MEKAQAYIEEIDKLGGAMKGIEIGYFQKEIQKSAYDYQKEIESKERIVVGVNRYISDSEIPIDTLKVDPAFEHGQIESLNKIRHQRDNNKVAKNLASLKEAALGKNNLIPVVVDCVKSLCTVGEICDVLRQEWGEYKENVAL